MSKTQETPWGSLNELMIQFPIIGELIERLSKEEVIELIETAGGPEMVSKNISINYFEEDN